MKSACIALAMGLAACTAPPPGRLSLRVELPPELARNTRALLVSPSIAETGRALGAGVVALELRRDAGPIQISLPGACPLGLDTRALATGTNQRSLEPLFALGPRERVVGLGHSFQISAEPRCPQATSARAEFVIEGGAPLFDVERARGGLMLRARTSSVLPAPAPTSGVVPVSARQQSELRTRLCFRVKLADGTQFEQKLSVAAVARSNGLHAVGLDHPLLLAGHELRLGQTPPGSAATLDHVGGLFELRPDLAGEYRVSDADGHDVTLHAARYDQTPLDCGRAFCHADIAASIQRSPMTKVLASDLGGCHALGDPACASACHATGEPGTADGGFLHVQGELALPALPVEYERLSPALQRLGGVGCLACHGPSKIPAPETRHLMLRSEVCAVCHDAPPRYGHVAALSTSRMAYADASPAVREDTECARCHTAWGALGHAPPPATSPGAGITCAVCHDVHPHGAKASVPATEPTSLLRQLPLPETIPNPEAALLGPSRVCVGCHAPSSDLLLPEASAAALVAGRGGSEPATGQRLSLDGPHAASPRGCLSCHDSGPAQLVLGKTHGFSAQSSSCARCHDTPPARDGALAERARALLSTLDPERGRQGQKPPHAGSKLLRPTPAATRALRDVLLVLEDPAADVHHPAYARALLDAAERFASRNSP